MEKPFTEANYRRGFWPFIITQFQGAFSDNLFKYILIYFFLSVAAAGGVNSGLLPSFDGMTELERTTAIAAWATMLFALPFILFPGIFGAIADRYSKQQVTVVSKGLEVGIMAVGGLALLSGNILLLWAILFLMAAQSAFFGPAKYGILPEILPESRLSWGNGIVQLTTMIAVIAGVGAASPVFNYLHARDAVHYSSALLVGLALLGLGASMFIGKPDPANPAQRIPLNPFAGMGAHIKAFRADRWLFLAVLAYTYFWFAGAIIQANLVTYGVVGLGLEGDAMTNAITQMAVAVSLGIGAGAFAAGYFSRGKIEVGLIPLGAIGMTIFSALLALDVFGFTTILALLFALGFFGGVFDVPLAATVQYRSPRHIRGGLMATTNMLTFVGIFVAGGLYWLLGRMDVGPRGVFLLTAVMSAAVGVYVCALLPVFALRLGLWVLANTIYRLKVLGRYNVPEQGGALLIANHTSFLDALVILAAIDRRVRFIMYQGIYEIPWIKPLARIMGAIPVSPGGGPREVVQSLRTATEAIQAGDLVCIFAEGQITRTGQMLPFRKGFERIMKGVDAPIIPVHIDRLWGSIFSFSEGRFFWKWPNRIPFPIHVSFGAPMPPTSNAFEVRAAIQELGTEAYSTRKDDTLMLQRAFARLARRNLWRFCIADARSGALSYIKTFAASVILGRKLKRLLAPAQMVGILLPQSVGSALTNIALQFMGKVPVNLNYTASKEANRIAAEKCGMKQIITSRAFLEQLPVDVPGDPIYLEDVMKTVTKKDRIIGLLLALLCPVKRLERLLGAPKHRSIDDLATVIFSSGSEGEPKGVMLTHFNVMSNVEAAIQVFPHKKGDCVVGMLPFFHSFGFTGTLWVVLTQNLSAVYHPNPLEAKQIGELCEKYKGKLLFTTSTFLQNFIRRCTPSQLSSLEHIVTGAEKLAPRVRDAFKEKFGIEPLEGYGTTECAPIVSLNVPDFRAPGFYQKGTKRGSIGHPIPGISVRIVDPDTREVLQNGAAGVLMIKGPNVMKGYLHQPEKTAQVLQDGWYETGDIATIDEDGFITITDRMARFSKIAGEMVSHTKVEEELQRVLGESERVLAVAGVPDATKGERLVVLHTMTDEQFDLLMGRLDQTGLPNLWVPKPKAFYKIDQIPILGTGKMDIKAVKTLARQLDIGE